jgi:hypothetical protein
MDRPSLLCLYDMQVSCSSAFNSLRFMRFGLLTGCDLRSNFLGSSANLHSRDAATWLSLVIARRADWKRAEQSAALSSRDFCGPVRRGKRRSA